MNTLRFTTLGKRMPYEGSVFEALNLPRPSKGSIPVFSSADAGMMPVSFIEEGTEIEGEIEGNFVKVTKVKGVEVNIALYVEVSKVSQVASAA